MCIEFNCVWWDFTCVCVCLVKSRLRSCPMTDWDGGFSEYRPQKSADESFPVEFGHSTGGLCSGHGLYSLAKRVRDTRVSRVERTPASSTGGQTLASPHQKRGRVIVIVVDEFFRRFCRYALRDASEGQTSDPSGACGRADDQDAACRVDDDGVIMVMLLFRHSAVGGGLLRHAVVVLCRCYGQEVPATLTLGEMHNE